MVREADKFPELMHFMTVHCFVQLFRMVHELDVRLDAVESPTQQHHDHNHAHAGLRRAVMVGPDGMKEIDLSDPSAVKRMLGGLAEALGTKLNPETKD